MSSSVSSSQLGLFEDPMTERLWGKLRNPNCTRCPLHENAKTICLLGDGPTPARFIAIGEAPGEREDEDAFRPFAGAAGRLLDETLEANDLNRDMFYVTNAAKCRPPGNRKPKKSEIVACNVFLRAELRIHSPEYVLLLGDSALSAALNIKGVMANRQRVIEQDGIKYFVALHPAAALHRTANKQLFKDDIAAFARLVNEPDTTIVETKVILVNTQPRFEAFLRRLAQEPLVAFDIETVGNPYISIKEAVGTITIFGCSFTPGVSWVVPLDHEEGWAPKKWRSNAARIAAVLFKPDKKLIAHNGMYDVKWFLPFTPQAEFTFDTMLAAFVLDENRSVSLENLSMSELQVKPWKSDVQYRRDFPLKKYALYNAKDCDYTLRLYFRYREKLLQQPDLRRIFSVIMMPAANIFARIENRGIYISEKRLLSRIKEAEAKERATLKELMAFVPKKMLPFNPGSSIQMARLMYSKEGLNIPFPIEAPLKFRNANKGLGSTAEGPMKLIKHPITKVLETWRYLKSKVLATYFYRWRRLRDALGYVHFNYNLVGAITGRISSDLHQVPRDPFIRGILGVESDDWLWGSADFSQAEMRVAAHLSQDPRLLHIFRTNEIDVHTNTAMKISGKKKADIDSETRKKAKAVNFGFLYRMFQKKFRDYAREKFEVELTLQEATDYRRGFFDEYAGLTRWHERVIRHIKMNGQIRYLDGRVRRLPDIWSPNEAERSEAERQGINSPVQGIVSDMALFAMVIGEYGGYGFEPLVDENFVWQGQLHDEVIFRVRKSYEDEKCQALKSMMENLPLRGVFGFEFSIPIVADVKTGPFWGESEPWIPK